jgi:hypothetical protein
MSVYYCSTEKAQRKFRLNGLPFYFSCLPECILNAGPPPLGEFICP